MSVLESMRLVLEEQLDDHRRNPSKFSGYAEQLKGAAQFAKTVATMHGDWPLIATADQVLAWLDQREDALEEESQAEHERIWERDQARYNIRKATSRSVKEFVGMEVVDRRWSLLVDEYRNAFPTFQIRNSVADRLHPKKLSASIRNHLCDFINAQRLGREPRLSEIQALHPQALVAHQEETLKYLERALPGFDFASALLHVDQAAHALTTNDQVEPQIQ